MSVEEFWGFVALVGMLDLSMWRWKHRRNFPLWHLERTLHFPLSWGRGWISSVESLMC